MLDMSKAFDTVRRNTLMKDLTEILDHGELHIISLMIQQVKLQIKVNADMSDKFTTNIGVPQGDCMSPVMFTLYLAQDLKPERSNIKSEHSYALTKATENERIHDIYKEHNYAKPKDTYITIDRRPQYADDIGWASNAKHIIDNVEKETPDKIKERNLNVNRGKTEKYAINREVTDNGPWKKCKYLGSLLDTNEDIKRRKGLAISAYNKLEHIFKSNINLKIKIRTLNAFVASIFLYNSELWTIGKREEEKIDIFQRKFLRRMLTIRWPKIISNTDLYKKTSCEKWS